MTLGIEHYGAFVAACVLMNATPGADTLYILTRSVAQGRRAGLWSAAGIMTGCLVHTAGAALGLSVLLASSAVAFNAVKLAGAAYLVWLGLSALLGRSKSLQPSGAPAAVRARTLFVQGLATNVLNPKVALFFLAFLPQFVDPAAGGPAAFAVLGLTFVTTGSLWSLGLVLASAWVSQALRRKPGAARWMNRGAGVVFLGLGAAVLVGEKH